MEFTVQGTLVKIFPTNEVSIDKHYRQFWLEVFDSNGQHIRFQLQGLSCAILDQFNLEDQAEVKFAISGIPRIKDGEEVLFNNINAFSIERID